MSVTINPINLSIQITRGDSLSFTIRNKATGLPFVFEQTDKIIMTVRRKISDAEALISKEFTPDVDGKILIVIVPTDTASLEYVTAYYDVQWSKLTGEVYTLIPASGNTAQVPTFQICPEVTRAVEVTP